MPPAPKPQWGQPVNGLRCGLSIDPEKVTLGEPVALRLSFENTTRKPINLYLQPVEAVRNVVIRNDDGQTLQIEIPSPDRWARTLGQTRPIHKIAPGRNDETIIEGKIVAASDRMTLDAGLFQATYSLTINDEIITRMKSARTESVWTGKLSSGKFALSVIRPPDRAPSDLP